MDDRPRPTFDGLHISPHEQLLAPRSASPTKRHRAHELTAVHVNFITHSVEALKLATEITGDSQTDVLNRSVQVYAYVVKLLDEGQDIYVENPATGRRERLFMI